MACYFELLVLSEQGKNRIKSLDKLAHLLLSVEEFIDVQHEDSIPGTVACKYMTYPVKIDISKTTNALEEIVFNLKIRTEKKPMSSLRGIILNALKGHFRNIYVIKDDVSRELCKDIYPLINEVENKLRQFIIHFMVLKIGSAWWELNVTDNVRSKSDFRTKKAAFNDLIDQEIYNIDFKDLSSFIYDNFSIYKSKNDILQAFTKCTNAEEMEQFRHSILSNWEKYFKDYFSQQWKSEWEEMAEIRNAVAHNKIIEEKMALRCKELHEEFVKRIEKSIQDIVNIQYNSDDLDIIKLEIRKQGDKVVSQLESYIKENYEMSYGDFIRVLKEHIDKGGFTTVDIIKAITGTYQVGDSCNQLFGKTISLLSKDLKIFNSDVYSYIDDYGRTTTTVNWKRIEIDGE